MLLTVQFVLIATAFVCAILSQSSGQNPPRVPLFIAVLLLCVVALIQVLPLK